MNPPPWLREQRDDTATVAPAPAPQRVLVLQRTVGNQAVAAMLARQPAAGYAKTSPQAEYGGILHREVDLLANARAIAAWLRARFAAPSTATSITVTAADIVADTALAKKLKPKPKEDADIQPTLDLMVYYKVLVPKGTGYEGVLNPATNDLDSGVLDVAAGNIGALSKEFDARAGKKDSVDPIGVTELLDPAVAAGAAAEKKEERDAQAAVTSLEQQLTEHVVLKTPGPSGKARPPVTRVTVDALPPSAPNAKGVDVVTLPVAGGGRPVEVPAADIAGIESVASGSDPVTVKLRTTLEAKLAKAQKRLKRAQGYRTFAVEVVDFLDRLHSRNTTFVGGTYPRHSWGEFSVDVFLNVGEDGQGFYKVGPTETFFDDLNATALEDGPWGKFQWRAVYNDDRMITTVGDKYGAGRISKAPHHGPAPDKLHIHLDVRPETLRPDAVTGFTVNASGRVDPF